MKEESKQANGRHKQASRVLLLMGIRYRGAGDVDELGYVYVNEILNVRVNVQGCHTRCTCERTYVILNVQNVRNRLHYFLPF